MLRPASKAHACIRMGPKSVIVKKVVASNKGKRLAELLSQEHDEWPEARLAEVLAFFKHHHNLFPM